MSNPPPFEFPRNPEQQRKDDSRNLNDKLNNQLHDPGEKRNPTTEIVPGKTISRTGTPRGTVKV